MFAFVGGALLIALVGALAVGVIAAIGWVFFVILLPTGIVIAVLVLGYRALKTHLAHQGQDISEFLPALPTWAQIPEELREQGGRIAAVAAGILGLLLPSLMVRGEATATIMFLLIVLLFWWCIPLAVHNTLNAPSLRDEFRFPLLAFLAAFGFGIALRIHPVVFLFLAALTAGYCWWWYEHHPYLKMLQAHHRCKELHAAAQLLSPSDFMAQFRDRYVEKWSHDPSPTICDVAGMMYADDCVRQIPPLPDMPRFKPSYPPGEDITLVLTQLERFLTELPTRTAGLVGGITAALDAYTRAVPRPTAPSVFTVAAREMVTDLPALVRDLGTAFPSGFGPRAAYDVRRETISRAGLTAKAYESGERIEPEAHANA